MEKWKQRKLAKHALLEGTDEDKEIAAKKMDEVNRGQREIALKKKEEAASADQEPVERTRKRAFRDQCKAKDLATLCALRAAELQKQRKPPSGTPDYMQVWEDLFKLPSDQKFQSIV